MSMKERTKNPDENNRAHHLSSVFEKDNFLL